MAVGKYGCKQGPHFWRKFSGKGYDNAYVDDFDFDFSENVYRKTVI